MLANNLDSLVEYASKADSYKHIKKSDMLRKAARNLYNSSQRDTSDVEKTFIHLYRFLKVYERLLKVTSDENFERAMFKKETSNAEAQLKILKDELSNIYKKQSEVIPVDKKIEKSDEKVLSVYLNKLFVSSDEVYRAFRKDNFKLLGVDIRSNNDFKASQIICFTCVNIPEEDFSSGMSAHVLTQKVSSDCMEVWEQREKYNCVIIIDYDITPTNYEASKACQLYNILTEWDLERSYKTGPAILNGGYMDFADRYPACCRNPHLRFNKFNEDLEDILDLDGIYYPSENDLQKMKQERFGEEDEVSPERIKIIIEENKKNLEKNRQLQEQLLLAEKNIMKLNKKLEVENNENNFSNILSQMNQEQDKLKNLYNLELTLKQERDNVINPFIETKNIPKKNLEEIVKLETDIDKKLEMRSKLYDERLRLLDYTRKAPKPQLLISNKHPEFKSKLSKPLIDRSTKPVTWWKDIENLIPELTSDKPYGLVGLRNIRNTCYMNSALQCLRHLDVIIKYILEDLYKDDIRSNATILSQFADLVKQMWSKTGISIEPYEFYQSFKKLAPVYGEGRHEDISEFLLHFINCLHEDISFELNMKSYNTTVKRAWYESQGGFSSYIVEAFYHEMQVNQPCQSCGDVGYKYEVDNVFYLEVPSRDFTIEEQLKLQLAPQFVEGFVCRKCKSARVKVVKSICHYPAVAIFVLKRWIGNGDNTMVNPARCVITTNNLIIGKAKYNLTAVALHTGSINSGHYTAVCKNPKNKRWYEFNDETVTEVDINSSKYGTQAYMLFYSYKIDTRFAIECPFFTKYGQIKHSKMRKIEN